MYYLIFFGELILLFVTSQFLSRSLSRVFYTLTRSMKTTVYLLAFLFLPGTLLHELAHYFAAAFLQVPVGNMKLLPEIHGDRVKLGSVAIAKTDMFRRALIGFAPFLVGMTVLLCLFYSFVRSLSLVPHWALALGVYGVFEIANTMFSSKKDLEGTIELVGALSVVTLVLFFAGLRIPRPVLSFILADKTLQTVQQGVFYMAIPLGVDIITICIAIFLLRLIPYRR